MRRPAAALPLPAGKHHLQRGVRGGRLAGTVDERERLRGGERRGRRREHGVARLRAGRRPAVTAGLGEDPRPRRVAGRLAQVQAAHARRAAGQDQRPDHADRLFRVHGQVRHPVADERGEQHRVRPAGEHRQVGQPARVVRGAYLGRHPVHRAGDRDGPGRPHVRGAKARWRDVRRLGQAGVTAAHPGDSGRGEERGDAGAHPARAVYPGERRPPPGKHRRTAVPVPVGKRGARQLGPDPRPEVVGQGGAQARREVVEHARRGQQLDHPVHDLLADAVRGGRPHHLGGLPRPVEQAHHGRRLAEPGQRAGTARVDADLERALVPPQRPQPDLHCWSHAHSVT